MATLRLEKLTKYYPGNPVAAVNQLDIECREGEFIALLGPSGCGKTSTLRMIAGLESITSGNIFIGDRLVNRIPPKERNVGLAFENYALYPPLTVYENLAFNLRARGFKKHVERERVQRIAELLSIHDLLHKKPLELSGGQKQRVNIARALIREPAVLLLDEPLSHLDARMRLLMRTELKRLHHDTGATTVLVTHDQLEAMALADRIAILDEGILQQYDTPYEVFNFPANEFVAGFIGEPPMNIFEALLEDEPVPAARFPESDLRLTIPAHVYDDLGGRRRIKVGIRPHKIGIFKHYVENSIPGQVLVVENLGDEMRLFAQVNSNINFIVSTPIRYDLKAHNRIYLQFDLHHTNFFDIDTGNRIAVRQAARASVSNLM